VGLPNLTNAIESFMDAIGGRWSDESFFAAYTERIVKLQVQPQHADGQSPEPAGQDDSQYGGEDEIPF